MNTAYKFRIYPNEEQRTMIAKTIGCCRFVYNHMLADKIACYKEQKAMLHNTDMLTYKLEKRGKRLVKVGRFYPSSKTCSCCGRINPNLRLSDRVYICECGNRMDRDVNAAINIRREGMRILCA